MKKKSSFMNLLYARIIVLLAAYSSGLLGMVAILAVAAVHLSLNSGDLHEKREEKQ